MEEAQAEERTEQLVEQAYTYIWGKRRIQMDAQKPGREWYERRLPNIEVKDGELYYKQKLGRMER